MLISLAAVPKSPRRINTVSHAVAANTIDVSTGPGSAESRDHRIQDGGARGNPPIYEYCNISATGYGLPDIDTRARNVRNNELDIGIYADVF